MKRANIECFGQQYKGVMLLENIADCMEYLQSQEPKIKEQAKELVKRGRKKRECGYVNHPTDIVVGICETLSEAGSGGSIYNLSRLFGSRNTDMIKHISRGQSLSVNYNGGYFPIPKDAIITRIERVVYTEEDIRITKFEGGRHFYANIGGIEVFDFSGDKRFNTYEYAESIAKEFLLKINQREV